MTISAESLYDLTFMVAEHVQHKRHGGTGELGCGLYVHTPFCETKCGYCDFFSVPLGDRATAPLVKAVIDELHARLSEERRRRTSRLADVRTVFIGGGTPTLLPTPQLAQLLSAVSAVVNGCDLEEFTVEANPATVDTAKAALLATSGVTRVSLGAQSFLPEELTTLERLHSPDDIEPSVAVLRDAGIGEISLDLIFGIPGQTPATWSHSLDRAIALQPNHVSCYGLTYEHGTRLTAMRNHGRLQPCDENLEADMYELTMDKLAAAGFEQYELSNYAQPGYASTHNLMYWRNQPYIGVGPSAAGCDGERRYKNISDVAGFVRMMREQGHAEVESESLDTSMLVTEMIMMQLRLNEGLSLSSLHRHTGVRAAELFGSTLGKLADAGLIEVNEQRLTLTRRGRMVANHVIVELASAIECEEREVKR